jgi:hypothetical protein
MKIGRDSPSGKLFPVGVAARERTLSRSSADYVFAGGKGQAAYALTQIIESAGRRYHARSMRSGRFITSK